MERTPYALYSLLCFLALSHSPSLSFTVPCSICHCRRCSSSVRSDNFPHLPHPTSATGKPKENLLVVPDISFDLNLSESCCEIHECCAFATNHSFTVFFYFRQVRVLTWWIFAITYRYACISRQPKQTQLELKGTSNQQAILVRCAKRCQNHRKELNNEIMLEITQLIVVYFVNESGFWHEVERRKKYVERVRSTVLNFNGNHSNVGK